MFESIKAQYKATLKSSDTEEHIDLAFYRPIGFLWALFFRTLHITPNVVTIISIFFGVAAGIFIYPENLYINIIGMLLLVVANSLDSADGQLARLTSQYSQIGRILDGMAGDLWFLSIYIAICLRTNDGIPFFAQHMWIVWTLAVAAGICHALQAAVADYFRQFHLMFVKKDFPTELVDSLEIWAQYKQIPWKYFFKKIFTGIYALYTGVQENLTPEMQALFRTLHREYPSGVLPADVSASLRRATLPLCKWENFMTFNWRSITLFITVLAGYPFVYFVIELTVFNIVLIYTLWKHEKICRSML